MEHHSTLDEQQDHTRRKKRSHWYFRNRRHRISRICYLALQQHLPAHRPRSLLPPSLIEAGGFGALLGWVSVFL